MLTRTVDGGGMHTHRPAGAWLARALLVLGGLLLVLLLDAFLGTARAHAAPPAAAPPTCRPLWVA